MQSKVTMNLHIYSEMLKVTVWRAITAWFWHPMSSNVHITLWEYYDGDSLSLKSRWNMGGKIRFYHYWAWEWRIVSCKVLSVFIVKENFWAFCSHPLSSVSFHGHALHLLTETCSYVDKRRKEHPVIGAEHLTWYEDPNSRDRVWWDVVHERTIRSKTLLVPDFDNNSRKKDYFFCDKDPYLRSSWSSNECLKVHAVSSFYVVMPWYVLVFNDGK
jgi:hypothetical protein